MRDEGYHTATPIQLQAIPIVLAQRDLMGCADGHRQDGCVRAAHAAPAKHEREQDSRRQRKRRAA